jgi:hypothetical protein
MSRESPEAAFEHARAAMARGDLPEVFACLDANDLRRIAENAVALSLGWQTGDVDEEVRLICHDHEVPLDDVLAARRRLTESPGRDATMGHRDTMKRSVASVANLPRFLGLLEGYTRRVRGGGSISRRLFQEETLTDVRVEGSCARGTRVHGPSSCDDVEFVRRKGEWFIKLITRPA